MIRVLDGPAVGAELACQRAPIFLRVVVDETTGKPDALDQLDDTPGPSERVYVYERVPGSWQPWASFACARGGRGCSEVAVASYRHVPGVDGEAYRMTDAWREWAGAQTHPEAEAGVSG